MAANKFATMLHRNTNKITLILIYAVLEWALIVLLLLNSLFSYLILRFADCFGLDRPCPWCSRLDHLFDSRRTTPLRDLFCHRHASEISRLGFCSSHRRLAELPDLCEDCLSSLSPDKNGGDPVPCENGELDSLKCSCCGSSVERELLRCTPQEDHRLSCTKEEDIIADQCRSDAPVGDHQDDNQGEEEFGEFKAAEPCVVREYPVAAEEDEKVVLVMEKKEEEGEDYNVFEVGKDSSSSSSSDHQTVLLLLQDDSRKEGSVEASLGRHLEFFIGGNDCELIPVEWTDSPVNSKSYPRLSTIMEEDQGDCSGYEDVIMDFCPTSVQEPNPGVQKNSSSGNEFEVLDAVEQTEVQAEKEQTEILENVSEEVRGSSSEEGDAQLAAAPNADTTEETSLVEGERGTPEDNEGVQEECASQNDEVEPEVSIGTEIPDQEQINVDEIHDEETLSWDLCREGDEAPSTSNDFLHTADFDNHDGDVVRSEGETLEFRSISIEMSSEASNHKLDAELTNENEDERIPDTPNSMDSLHQLHERLLLLEKRESDSIEESLDGSVMSDIEGDEGTLTVEKLKSSLKADRKALHALYTELEEERSASAVAASQTMAMINRLQEEKAAMQMEALQYQRMMEEQAEYDQEALQLLNDLMVKRERENQELEKELEVYRRKVEEYEAKEKKKAMMVVPRNSKDSSDSCSNEEESDGLSIDLNEEIKGGEDAINGHENTPSEAIWYLEDSLVNFEEERASILKQLKSLEEKILSVNGEEEEERHYKENGNGHVKTCDSNGEVNGPGNGHCKMNGDKHSHLHARFTCPKAKRLLPLFDAIGDETHEDWLQKTPADHFEVEDGKIAVIEEEVDHIYERLQVLEADREFLKHCIASLRKGDKGLELLGEILQHLRDLRCAELHGRNIMIGDGIMHY
ncbi:myosin-binding protein 3 [Punica granatum]|uniref:Myosin-binding protein 3 n=2 Tax=Punica granatum TaxID=22663 RepID=A0A6P8CBM0_PUNGR|nr:myosin-binding protein 3 [Punica granatum]XP_031381237.1 myosin-binding protein 3 [Punica granatum]PKI78171.1 hypothetical protein CRG98_001499 [Punica granatum]